MPEKLNLGCGRDEREGYIGVDKIETEAVDIVHDLNEFPYPFEENSFDYVLINHVLEHLEDVFKVIEEVHRISKPGGDVEIEVPYFTSRSAYGDPTHKHFFNYNTFSHFTGGSYDYYTDVEFEIVEREIILGDYPLKKIFQKIINKFPEIHEHSLSRSIFPTANLRVKLRVKK